MEIKATAVSSLGATGKYQTNMLGPMPFISWLNGTVARKGLALIARVRLNSLCYIVLHYSLSIVHILLECDKYGIVNTRKGLYNDAGERS